MERSNFLLERSNRIPAKHFPEKWLVKLCDASFFPAGSSEQRCFPGNIYNNNLKLSGYSGTLQSPEGGEGYLSHSSCNWLIAVPEGCFVKLSFDTFQMVQDSISGGCDADYVEVVDGKYIDGESEGKMCGSGTPNNTSSTGRYMMVLFRSGPIRSSFRGFKATFTALHEPTSK